MFAISPLHDDTLGEFGKLFTDYYAELGCDDDCAHLLGEYIVPDLKAGLIRIDYMTENGEPAGFCIYQTDGIENDWNFKEGWGDIREIYVKREKRRQGLGRFLLLTAEMKLRESNVNAAYALPAEGSEPFFSACGYKKTEGYNADLGAYVFEKDISKTPCKG